MQVSIGHYASMLPNAKVHIRPEGTRKRVSTYLCPSAQRVSIYAGTWEPMMPIERAVRLWECLGMAGKLLCPNCREALEAMRDPVSRLAALVTPFPPLFALSLPPSPSPPPSRRLGPSRPAG